MKTYILTFLFLLATFILNAQQFQWVKSFGGFLDDRVSSITTDVSGNVYTTGYFQDTVDFDPGVGIVNLTSNGGNNVFVQKLDASGNFVWAKSFGGSFSSGISISTDASGNVYTTGIFQDTVDFDPGVGIVNLTSNGFAAIFVHKMDSSGNFLWAKSFGGTLNNRVVTSITTDVSGNVYTTGYFQGTADFDPGVGIVNLTSIGSFDAFVLKMDASGNFLWAKPFGGLYASLDPRSITTDASGNVYTTGRFDRQVDFDPGAGLFPMGSGSNYYYDVFVQKMDASGNFLWAKSFASTGNRHIYSSSITTDVSGNVYTTGVINGTVDFDPGAGIFQLTAAGPSSNVFVQKMDTSGNFLWAKSFGGFFSSQPSSITTDASGNVYTTGHFSDTAADFDPGVGIVNLTSNGGVDVFVQKMDSSGNFLWAKSFGGTGYDYAYSITTDVSGNVYTAGIFEGWVDFDPGVGIVNLPSNGGDDGFIQKMSQCNTNFQTDIVSSCNSYTWIDGVTYTSSNNTATVTLTNSLGCDSVVTLNLTITNSPLISQPINQTVNIGNNAQFQFLTSGSLLNYQWQMDVGTGYVNLSNAGQFSGADTNLLMVSNVNMANNNTNFRCIITESSTCKDITNSVKLFVSSGTSIIEQTNSLVNLYPNPTSDFVTINLANKSKGQVIVLDLLGKVVLNKEFNSNQIQLSLKSIESKGTYLVKIIDSNGDVIANKKLIYQ